MSQTFDATVKLDDAYVMHTYGRLPVEFEYGNGAELIDVDGKRYLDFLSGIAYALQGKITPISAKTYFVTPQNVDILGAEAVSSSGQSAPQA